MCFSYSVNFNADALQSRLQLDEIILPASGFFFTAFTYPNMPVIIAEGNKNKMVSKEWGLIPTWAKDENNAIEMRKLAFNAKGETVDSKPMFRHAFKEGRCVIPAAGFYEWREVNKKKYPYYIFPKDHSFFLFAGIAETWTNQETGEIHDTFSIVTSPANNLLSMIHNSKKRMPLILDDKEASVWMTAAPETPLTLVKPYQDEKMEAYTIGPLASKARNDRNVLEVQDKYVYAELEQKLLL